ncbi:MAG TPA: HAD family hydrolase [bacterium]|nr:HAD family hydrolase [bacterium]
MRPMPADAIPEQRLEQVRLLASDIDDTLTENGKLTPEVLDGLQRLRTAGVKVWLVTGRCAAWGQALSAYLNVDGVIAENGGVLFTGEQPRLLADAAELGENRSRLREFYAKVRERVPAAEATDDNIGRLTDWTIDRHPLSNEQLALIHDLGREAGLRVIASSIHVHFFAGAHTKATALEAVCAQEGIVDRQQVVTLGDSPNDEPMFAAERFPFSVGVANIAPALERMTHRPLFILDRPEAAGAIALMRKILLAKGR